MDIKLPDKDIVAGEEFGQVFPPDIFGEILELRVEAPYTVMPVFVLFGVELMVSH